MSGQDKKNPEIIVIGAVTIAEGALKRVNGRMTSSEMPGLGMTRVGRAGPDPLLISTLAQG
ncbi:hypothetical protein [Sneathiella sp.]|uniref:hypothetical protein n=1 Tax=Sneathiella sp. TaxID=1964365 RepID=UPI0026375E58|nr:hypothetical protein [Sneathiella sp.]MDF2366695.1 hypothetical protein [Sneathiella sp.]